MKKQTLAKRMELLTSWGFKATEDDESQVFQFIYDDVEIKFNLEQDAGAYNNDGELGIIYDFYHLSQIIGELLA